jgi:hypothetical protein
MSARSTSAPIHTKHHGVPVVLHPVAGTDRRYRVGDTTFELTCGIRMYTVYSGSEVMAIAATRRAAVAWAINNHARTLPARNELERASGRRGGE